MSNSIPEHPKKTCTKCGVELSATAEYFHKDNKGKYGLKAICKSCNCAYTKSYNASHYEEQLEHRAKYRASHREQKHVHAAIYYAENRDVIRAKVRAYNHAHPEKRRVRDAAYGRMYRAKYPERRRNAVIRRRTRKRDLPDNFTPLDWQTCLNYWNGQCAYCGKQAEGLWQTVHQEHFIPLISSKCPGTLPSNILPACARCNHSKQDKDPHQWVIETFGKRKGGQILKAIDAYFTLVQV